MTAVESATRREWTAVATIGLASFVLITTEFLPVGFLDRLAEAFHVSQGTAGLMVTVPGLVAAVAAPLATMFAGRIDRRLVLATALALVAFSDFIVSASSSIFVALVGRVFFGMAVGIFWSFCVAVARRIVRDLHGHRATAMVLAGVSVGTVVGVPVGSMLAAIAGWRFAFVGAGVVTVVSLLILLLLLPSIPGEHRTSFASFTALFRIRPLLLAYLTIGLSAAGHFAAYTYLQALLIGHAHFGTSSVSWALFAYGISGAVGTFVGERITSIHLERAFLLVTLTLSASIAISALAGSSSVILLLIILWGAAFGALPVCTQLWIFKAAPQQFEAASAMAMTVFQTSLALGSLGGGFVFDRYGLTPAFEAGGALLLICALVITCSGQLQRR